MLASLPFPTDHTMISFARRPLRPPAPLAALAPALLVCALVVPAAGQQSFTEEFSGGSNVGAWQWGTGNETISPLNGNPGAYLKDLTLVSCCPRARTGPGTTSPYTGDYRTRGVTALGIDLITLAADFGVGNRPLTLMLLNDNGTPFNGNDDWGVYFIGDKDIPDAGVPIDTPAGWTSFDFAVDALADTMPAGWTKWQPGAAPGGNFTWPQIMADVDTVQYFYGDPTLIYLVFGWDVGLDNPRISEGACQTDLGFGGPGSSVLSLCGEPLATGGSADLLLTGTPPFAPVWLLAGVVNSPTPFKGGQLVPVPWLLLAPLASDGAGTLQLPGIAGGKGPLTILMQCVIQDVGQPTGWGLSNALQVQLLP
ncbi:MAG: hypothetical protein ACYTG2_07565 [Planctomycetota bacterium]|jgi:hypothetical protein